MSRGPSDLRNGWTLYLHPAFRLTFDALVGDVEKLRTSLDLEGFAQHPKTRILTRITKLVLVDIPSDPASSAYELGNSLGSSYRHWRQAKFNQRYRLFFRYSSDAKVIIHAWMNDEATLRARGARNDPYAVFAKRLERGDPPDSFDDLLFGL